MLLRDLSGKGRGGGSPARASVGERLAEESSEAAASQGGT